MTSYDYLELIFATRTYEETEKIDEKDLQEIAQLVSGNFVLSLYDGARLFGMDMKQ